MLREPDVPWQEVRERGVVLSHLTGPPDTFPGDTMCHEAGCQGNKEEAGTARDQLSVCGLAASLFSTREGEWGPFEGHGAWLPACPLPHLGPIPALKSQPGTGTLVGGELSHVPAPAHANWLRKNHCRTKTLSPLQFC